MKSLHEIYKNYSMNDCGGDKGTQHSYIDIYEQIFSSKPRSNINLFEIGIYQGHSLMMWSEYFENSNIVGADIDISNIKFNFNSNVKIIEANIVNNNLLNTFLSSYGGFDYIIDDGSHKLHDQLYAYSSLSKFLKDDGVYIIEDIENINESKEYFKNLSSNVEIFDLRNVKNRYDDVLIAIRK